MNLIKIKEIHNAFWNFSQNNDLIKYVDKNRNQNIPKVLDNLIIGSVRLNKK